MRYPVILLFIPFYSMAQITPPQQSALNAIVTYANDRGKEVSAVHASIIAYYSSLNTENRWQSPRYVCPARDEPYYEDEVNKQAKNLPSRSLIMGAVLSLKEAYQDIDRQCKALDTYHKLEDYKRDQFHGARKLIDSLEVAIANYRQATQQLDAQLQKAVNTPSPAAYSKLSSVMRQCMQEQKIFMEGFVYNLEEESFSGWDIQKIEQSILSDYRNIKSLAVPSAIQYPASSMAGSFKEGIADMITLKRNALDEQDTEERSSDKYGNAFYLSLINYYNNVLVSFYNAFIDQSGVHGFHGLKALTYIPAFRKTTSDALKVEQVDMFKPARPTLFSVTASASPIKTEQLQALLYYIEYINQTFRSVRHMHDLIRNLNSSASYYAGLTSFSGHGGLTFNNKDFTIPRSYALLAINNSTALPPAYAERLNGEVQDLQDLLKEMEQRSELMEEEIRSKSYEKDKLKNIYTHLYRFGWLFNEWDLLKEQLYTDVRKVFESFKKSQPDLNWQKSGDALQTLIDLNRKELFKVKALYKGADSVLLYTADIEKQWRKVVADEFINLKGIEKLGRNNGLCPYTPYEDLPEHAKRFVERLSQVKEEKGSASGEHPYHRLVYIYNEMVDDHNTFCTLAKVPLLPSVKQPELLLIQEPAAPRQEVEDVHPDEQSMNGYATNHLVLLLDASGSMNQPDKLPLLKKSMTELMRMMREEDKVSLIAFSGKPRALLTSVSFKQEETVNKAIAGLNAAGKTDGKKALALAYKIARDHYIAGGNNRVLLATDGQFPADDELVNLIEQSSQKDIFLSVFDFGVGMGSGKILQSLAEKGKGNYQHILPTQINSYLIREVKAKKKIKPRCNIRCSISS